jgi:uncharacterized protein (TIGR00369 family)
MSGPALRRRHGDNAMEGKYRFAEEGEKMLARALREEQQEFGSFFLSRLLGMDVSYADDTCVVTFEAMEPMFNPQGTLHGGILATAMDISMCHLLNHVLGAGTTLEMKVQYLAPVTGGLVRCEGSFLRNGRNFFFLQSHARRADGELAAHATSTWTRRSSSPPK